MTKPRPIIDACSFHDLLRGRDQPCRRACDVFHPLERKRNHPLSLDTTSKQPSFTEGFVYGKGSRATLKRATGFQTAAVEDRV